MLQQLVLLPCGGSSNTSSDKVNLAGLTAIDAPASFKINGNIKTVSARDLKDALAPIILKAVENISRPGVLTKGTDYDYQLFTDISREISLTANSDLTHNIDVFIKITATDHTTILKPDSSTKVIHFTLPAANNLSAITTAKQFGELVREDFPFKTIVEKTDIIAAIAQIENDPSKPSLKKSLSLLNSNISDITKDITWKIVKPDSSGQASDHDMGSTESVSLTKPCKVWITITPATDSTLFTSSSAPNIEVLLPRLA